MGVDEDRRAERVIRWACRRLWGRIRFLGLFSFLGRLGSLDCHSFLHLQRAPLQSLLLFSPGLFLSPLALSTFFVMTLACPGNVASSLHLKIVHHICKTPHADPHRDTLPTTLKLLCRLHQTGGFLVEPREVQGRSGGECQFCFILAYF